MPFRPILVCLVLFWRAQGEWYALLVIQGQNCLQLALFCGHKKCDPASAGL